MREGSAPSRYGGTAVKKSRLIAIALTVSLAGALLVQGQAGEVQQSGLVVGLRTADSTTAAPLPTVVRPGPPDSFEARTRSAPHEPTTWSSQAHGGPM